MKLTKNTTALLAIFLLVAGIHYIVAFPFGNIITGALGIATGVLILMGRKSRCRSTRKQLAAVSVM